MRVHPRTICSGSVEMGKAGAWRGRRHAPLVLILTFPQRVLSPRWKQIVQPAKGRFTHHLELWRATDIDAQVVRWLARAWREAASPRAPAQ